MHVLVMNPVFSCLFVPWPLGRDCLKIGILLGPHFFKVNLVLCSVKIKIRGVLSAYAGVSDSRLHKGLGQPSLLPRHRASLHLTEPLWPDCAVKSLYGVCTIHQ